MNISYGLVDDLTRKLKTYSINYDFQAMQKYNEENNELDIKPICQLILKSTLNSIQLTREAVIGLLKGEIEWPKEDGTFLNIKTNVTLEELESMYLVRFVRCELQVMGQIKYDESLNDKATEQIQAINNLYDIRWGRNGLIRNRLVIDQTKRNAAPKCNEKDDSLILELANKNLILLGENDNHKFTLSHDLIKPIGSALWPLLIDAYGNGDKALNQWVYFMAGVFDYSDIFQIEFKSQSDEDLFLNEAINLIVTESDFMCTWEEEIRKLLAEHDKGFNLFYNTQHTVNVFIGDTAENQNSETTVKPLGETGINSPNKIYMKSTKEPEDFLQAYLIFSKNGYRINGYSDLRGNYYNLLHLVIKHEKLLYDASISFKRIQILLDNCLRRPGLACALLNLTFDPLYISYLLTRRDTATVAMLHLVDYQNVPANHISSHFDYQEQWQSIIWQQSLDIYFSHFELINGGQRLEEAGKTISDLLIELSNGVFFPFRGGMAARVKACLLESLTFLEKAQYKEYTNATNQSLLQSILPLFYSNVLRHIELTGDNAPYKEWYLLFWCLDKSSLFANNLLADDCDSKKLSKTIAKSIYDSYSLVIQKMLNGSGLALDGDAIFDQLDWKLMFDLSASSDRTSLITILDSKEIIAKQISSDNNNTGRQIVAAIRMHIRILMNIYSRMDDLRSSDACNIAQQLVIITNLFGFDKVSVSGVFDIINDGSDNFSRVHLWERLVGLANSFEDSTFQQFMNQISNITTPWRSILTLYNETVYEKRRQEILKRINGFDIDKNRFITVTEMRDTLLLAVNSGLTELADTLLEYGKNKVSERFKSEWSGLDYKITLQKIYQNDKLSIEERFRSISTHEIPQGSSNTGCENNTVKQDLEQYKRFLLALLYFETDPEKCYLNLNALCEEKSNPMFASNRLAVQIKLIESSNIDANKVSAYNSAIAEWNKEELKFSQHVRSLRETKLLLICYSNINNTLNFNQLWDKIPTYNQASFEFISVRCKFLQNNDLLSEANAYLDEVKRSHCFLPDSIAREINGLKAELLNKIRIKNTKVDAYVTLTPGRPTVNEARNMWLEILQFNDIDHASLFAKTVEPDYQLEQFIIENVTIVCKELLLRSNNLLRLLNNNKNTNLTFEEENIINDWFTSLFEQRMSYLLWSVGDQKRSGRSQSGIGPGNPDGWISNSGNDRLFIYEAFRLTTCDTTVINTHIDKVTGYDSIGCSPIVVVVYCFCNDFVDLCNRYIKHLSDRQYNGFDALDLSSGEIRYLLQEPSANMRVYREIRLINKKPIVIYHVMMLFKEIAGARVRS